MDPHPEQVCYFDTPNDHYAIDIDMPQDLDTVRSRLSCTVELPDSPALP